MIDYTLTLPALLSFGLTLALVRWCIFEYFSVPSHLRKLPGPRQFPLVGRVHDFPIKFVWFKFKDWADEHGPIYRTTAMGKTIIVISSEKIAQELLEKRGAIYSDRPAVPALVDSKSSKGSGEYLPLMGRNEYWARQRHFAHNAIGESVAAGYYGYPELEAKRFLFQLLMTPYRYSALIEDYTAKVICRLAWGHHEESEELKKDAWALLTQMSPAGPIINVVTALKLIPTFLNPWKLNEVGRHTREKKWFHALQVRAKEELRKGTLPPSWSRRYLENPGRCQFDGDVEGSYAVGMLAVAGVFTIGGPLHTFFLAMVQHKHWLQMAQEEVDRVAGNRMPVFADSEKVPTLRAIIKECLRWRPAVPTGVAHELEADDEIDGYFIPKGATILPLEWAFSRDESVYPDAESFRPERWLDPKFPTYLQPPTQYPTIIRHSLFGWGRRTCQGMSLTAHELLVGCAGLVWAFNFSKKKDQFGRDLPVDLMKSNTLLIIKPDAFGFDLEPRTPERAQQVIWNWHEVEAEEAAAAAK